jgi:hypothetical protein
MADGVVAGGEEEPVAALPVRVLCAEIQLVPVDGCEHVSGAQGLAHVSLALDLAHVQGVVPDPVGGGADLVHTFGRHCGLQYSSLRGGVLDGFCRHYWLRDRLVREVIQALTVLGVLLVASSASSRSRLPQVSRVAKAAQSPIRA